jgi:ribosomal protein S18 acetylase RimI-like enzyme
MFQLHLLHAENRPDIYRADAAEAVKEYFQQFFQDPRSISLVAEEEGELVGICLAKAIDVQNPLLQNRKVINMEGIYVDPACRKKGTGRALLEAMCQQGKERGASSFQLKVWGFNQSAQAFYQAVGMNVQNMTMEISLQ